MPSAAYAEWELYKRDAELLEALGDGAGGVDLPLGGTVVDAEGAARRAVVLFLTAAYERYVVELFRAAVNALGGQCSRHAGGLAWTPHGGPVRRLRLRNPAPGEVRALFAELLPGHDIWAVSTPS